MSGRGGRGAGGGDSAALLALLALPRGVLPPPGVCRTIRILVFDEADEMLKQAGSGLLAPQAQTCSSAARAGAMSWPLLLSLGLTHPLPLPAGCLRR